ncbi:MAG: arginine--tRNA ligase [Crocinitomicaceae bacterium]|nr:arginine--tRNA ligase [Crocinitomicaceae bacterium]
MIESKIKEALLKNSQSFLGVDISSCPIQFQKTRKDVDGDITLVVFPFVKILKCSPKDAGDKIGDFLDHEIPEIKKTEAINGFLNISLSDTVWLNEIEKIYGNPSFGFSNKNSKELIMVEYSSPNTNKPLHLGHLRNIFLGDSVSEILKANGHKVVKTQIINDRGIHICKSMLAWKKFAPLNKHEEKETPNNTGIKGDKFVGKYYVEFEKHLKVETELILKQWDKHNFEDFDKSLVKNVLEIKATEKTDKLIELARNSTSLMQEAKQLLILWEARDPEVYLLWETMNAWVYNGFEKTYEKMGVNFDKYYYESQTYEQGKEVVSKGLNKRVFFKKQDGSIWINLEEDGLDNKLLLRSDGTSVYMTQDIGTALDRFHDFPEMQGMIYTVGNEQDYHFNVLFLILKKLGYSWAQNCHHLSYGMVDLPTGKMKSREGTVVDADDLMNEVINKAAETTKERGHLDSMTKLDKEDLFKTIGLGGLKYYLLKVDPKKRMMFNPDESIELTGNTGPFIQYTYARILSLINKGKFEFQAVHSEPILSEEKEVIKHLIEFPNVISESAKNLSPAIIANYLYELVKLYNHFYQSIPILKEKNEDKKSFRLAMSSSVANAIENGLKLLGIKAPEKM